MLMRVGVLRGAAVIGEVYVLHRLPFTVKLSRLIILSVTTIFLTRLGMRPLRFIFRLRISIPKRPCFTICILAPLLAAC